MKYSSEMLMAYADGELEPAERAAIEAEMARDPEVARIVEGHRALRRRLESAYAGVLGEQVPSSLSDPLAAAAPAAAKVTELAARRAAPRTPVTTRTWLPQWAAMAASLSLGLAIGWLALRAPESPITEEGGHLLARGELAGALDRQLTSDMVASGSVRVGFSFQDQGGHYCRTFRLEQDAAVAGLACRAAGQWRIRVLAAAESADGELRAAGTLPAAVLLAVDAAIEGDPLDAEAEAAAREAGWQPR